MRIEKLNEYQIKFLLSNQDLKDRNITFSDLLQRSDKLQNLVREIMKKASETIDFHMNDTPVMVEALPHKDGIALIVSKTPEKNEDSARRRLTSLYNEFVEHRLFDRNTEESIYNAIKQKAEDENIQGTEQSIPCVIFSFADLSSVITACSISAPDYTDESSLYKMDDKYFLVLRCAYKNLHPSVRNCFTEYGESCPVQNGRLGMLTEYGKVLVETGAVQAMAECN